MPGPTLPYLAPIPLATAAVAWFIWRGLANEAQLRPFVTMGLFVLTYVGLAISLYPTIVPHHFTLWQAAASGRAQAFLQIGTLVLLSVILMYTGWL